MKRTYRTSQNLDSELQIKAEKELKLGFLNLKDEMFEQAELNFKLTLKYDKTCPDAYWGLMLAKFQIPNEDLLFQEPVRFKEVVALPEFKKALEFASKDLLAIYNDLLEKIYEVNQGDNY